MEDNKFRTAKTISSFEFMDMFVTEEKTLTHLKSILWNHGCNCTGGYHGTFHYFSKKYLDRYVDEFSFRLNSCSCQLDTMDKIQNLCRATSGKRLTYKKLIK